MKTSIIAAVSVALAAETASAQCSKDTDCKGDRICSAGQCVAPPSGGEPAPAPPAWASPGASTSAAYGNGRSHWARPAGVVGIISGTAVIGFGIASALSTGASIPAVPLGAASLLSAAVGAPIVAVGASSARFDDSITGSPPTRVTGWIAYGLAMTSGAAMVITGFVVTYPSEIILVAVALGAGSIACLTIDAFISAGQADDYRPRAASSGTTIVPTVTLVRGRDGSLVPLASIAGVL